jgi:hypothetical protein
MTFRLVTFSDNGFLSIYVGHEANIRGGGKTVHVVFKYLSPQKPDEERGGDEVMAQSSLYPILPNCSVDISCKNDVTVILLLGVFLHDVGH